MNITIREESGYRLVKLKDCEMYRIEIGGEIKYQYSNWFYEDEKNIMLNLSAEDFEERCGWEIEQSE
jgi:hypothetical protein